MTTYVHASGAARAPVQQAAHLTSAVFLPAGVLGFVPGITAHHASLGLTAHDSGAELLGLFQVSVLHNLLHLALGLAGLAAARTATAATAFLLAGGAAQLVLWLYGLTAGHPDTAEAVPMGTADDGLRLLLAAVMFALGVVLGRRAQVTSGHWEGRALRGGPRPARATGSDSRPERPTGTVVRAGPGGCRPAGRGRGCETGRGPDRLPDGVMG